MCMAWHMPHVGVHVCMHACAWRGTHACMHAHMHASIHTPVHTTLTSQGMYNVCNACTYVHACGMHACMHVHGVARATRRYACIHACAWRGTCHNLGMHVWMHACVRACVHVCMCGCVCMHACMCACVHVCMYAYVEDERNEGLLSIMSLMMQLASSSPVPAPSQFLPSFSPCRDSSISLPFFHRCKDFHGHMKRPRPSHSCSRRKPIPCNASWQEVSSSHYPGCVLQINQDLVLQKRSPG
jgi:hypothetical protein